MAHAGKGRMKSRAWMAGVIGTIAFVGTTVATQTQTPPAQPAAGAAKSVGRGWPLAAHPRDFQAVGPGGGGFGGPPPGGALPGGAPPAAGAPGGGRPGGPPGGAQAPGRGAGGGGA